MNAFAEQSGLQLLYSAELAEGKTIHGVSGRLTPEQALQTLLEGTGVSYRFVDPGTVTLARPDPLAELVARARRPINYAQATQPAPDTPKAPAKKSAEGPTVLPEMTVTATPLDETSYNPPNATTATTATTATKTDTPIMETPVSIQVVPQQVIRDQQAIRLEDAVKNVSGVQRNWSYGDLEQHFIIRGQTTDTFATASEREVGEHLRRAPIWSGSRCLKAPPGCFMGASNPAV